MPTRGRHGPSSRFLPNACYDAHYSRPEVLHTPEITEFFLDFSTGLMIGCGKLFEPRFVNSRPESRLEVWSPFGGQGFHSLRFRSLHLSNLGGSE